MAWSVGLRKLVSLSMRMVMKRIGVEKVDQGSEVCQDDLVLMTTECLNVHLHKTAPVFQIHPVSSVWLRAQGLRHV